MRGARSLCLVLALSVPVGAWAQSWTNLGGGDHGGSDWVVVSGTAIAGTHFGIGRFVVDAGVNIAVRPFASGEYGAVEVYADSVFVGGR